MKEIGFMAVAAVIGGIASAFLPVPPGLDTTIIFIGTLAAIAGGIVGIVVAKQRDLVVVLSAIIVLLVAVFSVIQFIGVANGEPGANAAVLLYCWTVGIFLPVGVLIELAGLKWTQ